MEIVAWAVVMWLVVLSVHDMRSRVLPNRLTVPAASASIAMACSDTGVAASVVVLSTPYLIAALSGACGGGDLKLAVGLGGLVGDPWTAAAVVLAAAAASLVVGLSSGVRHRTGGVAHGPALAAAALTVGGVWLP